MAPAPAPQLDGSLLLQLVQTTTQTAEQTKALHDALLGEHGHVKRINDDIDRLYGRDKERQAEIIKLREDLHKAVEDFKTAIEESTEALRANVQPEIQDARSFRDRLKGSWALVLAVAIVARGAMDLIAILKGKP